MTSVVESVLVVFEGIGSWMVNAFQSLTPIFYDATNGLTFVGVLAVCGLGVAITLLILNIIRGFLSFR